MPPDAAALSFVDNGADATFTVDFTPHGKYKNEFNLWLRFSGIDENGDETTASFTSFSGQASITVPKPTPAPPGNNPVVSYRAFVWYFPDPNTPISNTVAFS